MKPRTLRLDIGTISVDGLPEAEHRSFSRALETGLRELAASGWAGAVPASRDDANWNAGLLPRGSTARQAATQVVNRIRQGLADQAGGHHA